MALFSTLTADRRNKIFVLLFYEGVPKASPFYGLFSSFAVNPISTHSASAFMYLAAWVENSS